jgi:hypothetical protein
MARIYFQYRFHAVGQGLFASGSLTSFEEKRNFNWVFDCGSSSRRVYLQREISGYSKSLERKPINLFSLSHFDEDHINGAKELLSRQAVDLLVMPYFTLAERILIALGTPGISNDYLGFLVDPVGYMYAAGGDNLRRVVLIAGGGEGPGDSEEGPPPGGADNPEGAWELRIPETEPLESPAAEDLRGISDSGPIRNVRVIGHQMPFIVGGVWEFLFYNESIPPEQAARLRSPVAAILRNFRNTDGSYNGTELLREIKPLYVKEFGSSGLGQNRISLIEYSGPMGNQRKGSDCFNGGLLPAGVNTSPFPESWHLYFTYYHASKTSIGYFGDFPLTTPERIADVRAHFGPRRWDRLEIVQIPHHGSAHSWYDGASGEFRHEISVISSARYSEHHPSPNVLDDLSTHMPILVNELQGAVFNGFIDSQ